MCAHSAYLYVDIVSVLLFFAEKKNVHRYWSWSSPSLIIGEQCFSRNTLNDTPKYKKHRNKQTQIRLIIILFCKCSAPRDALFIIIDRHNTPRLKDAHALWLLLWRLCAAANAALLDKLVYLRTLEQTMVIWNVFWWQQNRIVASPNMRVWKATTDSNCTQMSYDFLLWRECYWNQVLEYVERAACKFK